jgi:dipeptidyl aminopeptidase/acylaminoacyl peptidase
VGEGVLSAQEAVQSIHDYAALRFHQGHLYGLSFDAATGRNRLCRFEAGEAISLLPDHLSVRSRVHEYGGGAWCLADERFCFVNDSDQQIWCQPLDAASPAYPLTTMPDTRFADLQYDARHQRLLAISEQHTETAPEPINRLVTVELEAGGVETLAAGADFYSSPALSPTGDRLAWVEWDHPQQPWRCTRLMLADLNGVGQIAQACQVSDTQDAAWLQPRFSPKGQLHAVVDRDNWWRIEALTPSGFEPLHTAGSTVPERTEFTTAPWQFGLSTYGWTASGELVALGQCDGYTRLWRFMQGSAVTQGWQPLELGLMPTRLHALCLEGTWIGCVAEFADREPAIVKIDTELDADDPDQCTVLAGGHSPTYVPSLPLCEWVDSVPYFLYRPANVPHDQPLPLVIWTHGGPTASTAPVLKPAIQYWTQRGFMIADVNYRGSTGYGRDYRLQLAGQWGITDVEDVEAIARSLIEQGRAQPDAIFIRGNSAGGYTTLSTLCRSSRFSGGASLYGVSDPARLNQLTHKFESRYLHWLIGDPETEPERYTSRSPLMQAHCVSVPVIFFQGEQDKVVLPEQTRRMAQSLSENGIRVETLYFPDEAHGFRQPENQAQVLERELAFYRSIIDAASNPPR